MGEFFVCLDALLTPKRILSLFSIVLGFMSFYSDRKLARMLFDN